MNEDYLAHYGVIGMRWGVRHDRQKAYRKAEKKLNKLNSKSEKQSEKAEKHRAKSERKAAIGMGSNERARQARLAGKYSRQSEKTSQKAEKWLKSMEDVFSETPVSKLKV